MRLFSRFSKKREKSPEEKQAEAHFIRGLTILDEGIKVTSWSIQSGTHLLPATEEFKTAAELVPNNADYHFFHALALRHSLQFKSAIEQLKKVLEVDPNNFEAKKTLEENVVGDIWKDRWKDAFFYPRWSESSKSVPESLKSLLYQYRKMGQTEGHNIVILREGGSKVVSCLFRAPRSVWHRPLNQNMIMKLELVHSKTPYGSVVAFYLLVGDNPAKPYKSETFLNPNPPTEELKDITMAMGKNLLRLLFRQDHTYLIFVDEYDNIVLNKRLAFDSTMQKNFRDIEKALAEIERRGETLKPTRFQQAAQWHSNNFPLEKIRL